MKSKIRYELTYLLKGKKNRLTDIENRSMVTKGLRRQGKDKLVDSDLHIQPTIYKIDKQQDPTVQHGELYSISYNKP